MCKNGIEGKGRKGEGAHMKRASERELNLAAQPKSASLMVPSRK